MAIFGSGARFQCGQTIGNHDTGKGCDCDCFLGKRVPDLTRAKEKNGAAKWGMRFGHMGATMLGTITRA